MAHVYISTVGATLIALFSIAAVAETPLPGASGIEGTIVVSPSRPVQLRDRVAFISLYRLQVWLIYYTAQINIVVEVAGIDWIAFVGANLLLVRSVNDATAIHIGREEAKRNVAMLLAVAVDVLDSQRDDFRAGHTS